MIDGCGIEDDDAIADMIQMGPIPDEELPNLEEEEEGNIVKTDLHW